MNKTELINRNKKFLETIKVCEKLHTARKNTINEKKSFDKKEDNIKIKGSGIQSKIVNPKS
jgi:hypothetical protein